MGNNKKIAVEIANALEISSRWINKYTVVTVLFIVWVVFFDKHNVFSHYKMKAHITKLENEKVRLDEEISQALQDKEDLINNLDKFAREKHLMHLQDEEIILIEKSKK